MKKRNCRKTKDERRQHDVAIRIRKMTDAQIFELVGQVENANPGAGTAPLAPAVTVGQFIDHLDALSGTGNRSESVV